MTAATTRAVAAVLLVALAQPVASATDSTRAADLDAVAARIVDGTNRLRRDQGLAALQPDAALTRAAEALARHMADTDRYGHEADGRTPVQRAQAQGYRHCWLGENIALAQDTRGFTSASLADRLLNGWQRSPPHRRNMLAADATQIGVAIARGERSGRHYAVQVIGRPWSQRLRFEVANAAGTTVAYRVGDERQTLPPRAVRTHTVCGATRLTLPRGGEWRRVDARDGERYAIDAPAPEAAAAR